MDAQFRNAEQASRLKISLDLDNSDHYDQVIAISQGMINHAIKRIHEQNEDMNDFYGDSDSGSISADLAPSELVIPVGDPAAQKNNMVIWRTNIKQGTLTVNYRDVPPKDYIIDNWTIDVKVPLTWEKFEDAPDDDAAKRNRKKKQRDFIHDNFEVPGDYRPERLYAKMASGWWGEGVSFAGPSSIVDESSDEYKTWKEVKDNEHASSTLESIFKGISLQREEDGMTTIGTRFNLDAAKIVEHAATFAPTSMIHQSFPYRIGPESGKTGWETGIRGTGDPGSRNCLLYCENVDNRQMSWRQLPQTGNFTTIGNPNSLGSRVDGTFVLSHQLIFEKYLLPKLQIFVKESQIYPGPANIELNGQHSYGLEIGANPSKDPYRNPNNPIYRFRAVPANGYVDAHYEAYVESTYEPNLFKVEDSDAKAKYNADMDRWHHEKLVIEMEKKREEAERKARDAIDAAFDQAVGALRAVPVRVGGVRQVEGLRTIPIRVGGVRGGGVRAGGVLGPMPEEPPLDHAKYWGEGSPRVTVKWQKGGNRITVSGETNYNVYITIANNTNVNASHQLQNARWWEIVRWVFTWELYIDVTVKDGSLDLSITHDKDPFVKAANYSQATDPNHHHGTQSSLAHSLQQHLEDLERALSRSFTDTSKFFYPGNGQLIFKNAMFSEKGDLIAEIAYQDTPDQGKIIIPPPKKPDNPGGGGKDKPTSRLEWTAITPVKSSASPVEIKITGKNNTNSTVYLSKIEVKYTGFKMGKELFKSIDFVTTNGGADKVEISVQAESASTMLTPVLASHKLTSKKAECLATYKAATSPIAVQPGGSIDLIAKGATGEPGLKKDLGIKEFWCDQAGKVPEGDGYFMAFVAVELS